MPRLIDQRFMVGNTLPFAIPFDPGIREASVMDKGLLVVCAFGAVDAGHDRGITIKVPVGLELEISSGLNDRSFISARY